MSHLYKVAWPPKDCVTPHLRLPVNQMTHQEVPDCFDRARALDIPGSLIAQKRSEGIFADLLFGDGNTVFVNDRFVECLSELGEAQYQLFPCEIVPDGKLYYVLNVLLALDCVDRDKSKFQLWLPEDDRPDKLGQFRSFDKMVLDPNKVPPGTSIFRLEGYRVALIVTQRLADTFNRHGITGFSLEYVTGEYADTIPGTYFKWEKPSSKQSG